MKIIHSKNERLLEVVGTVTHGKRREIELFSGDVNSNLVWIGFISEKNKMENATIMTQIYENCNRKPRRRAGFGG